MMLRLSPLLCFALGWIAGWHRREDDFVRDVIRFLHTEGWKH